MAYARTNDWANGYCPYVSVDANINSQNNATATVSNTTSVGGAAYTNANSTVPRIFINTSSTPKKITINASSVPDKIYFKV